jgi:polo-like kinase 4
LLLKLYNYFEDSNYVYLVLEMCHNGEMGRHLKDRKAPFSEEEGQWRFESRILVSY